MLEKSEEAKRANRDFRSPVVNVIYGESGASAGVGETKVRSVPTTKDSATTLDSGPADESGILPPPPEATVYRPTSGIPGPQGGSGR